MTNKFILTPHYISYQNIMRNLKIIQKKSIILMRIYVLCIWFGWNVFWQKIKKLWKMTGKMFQFYLLFKLKNDLVTKKKWAEKIGWWVWKSAGKWDNFSFIYLCKLLFFMHMYIESYKHINLHTTKQRNTS